MCNLTQKHSQLDEQKATYVKELVNMIVSQNHAIEPNININNSSMK